MFNLIRRDLILQKKQLLIFIPFILFFIIMDTHPALTFLVASIFIPFNTYAYDEKAETNILLNSLPYTRTEIIASRYIGAVIYMIISIGLAGLAMFIFNNPFTLTDIAIGAGLFFIFVACTFPLFYILKPGHISTGVLISFLVLAFIGPRVVIFGADHLTAVTEFVMNLSTTAIYTGGAVIITVLYAVSWGITHFIYQQKAF
ncbi:multidrug ABC transporter permease [Alteribacter lacisalsi]|uniref:Multidrug ABC transporter permease n=1 Tax=Alteribacter lacisalsi TaxID=2045244 RepID=A0A2W0H4M7_9BACI|nr:ABC-2 transporter permease [Alteribacter lacisalsi]PYZ95566.1 multidrug ABC transporter permease [Alteribacter lacisalsi]